MVSALTPARSAWGTWANHSYCARHSFAVAKMANSESRGATAVLKRQWPPSCCASSPKAGACRNTANGPRMVVLPPRGPERIESSSARCAGVSLSSARMETRGGGIFLTGFLAGFLAGIGPPHYAPSLGLGGALGLLEQQRLDDDRYHVGEFDDAPDVDVIEFLELHAVNRNDVGRGRDLVADDAAEALADVAVDQEHQRHVLLQRPRQRGADAGRDRMQAPMRGIAAPRERKRDRAFPFLEVGARERAAHGGSDGIGGDVAVGREVARQHRQVLQRQLVGIGDQDGVAADLNRKLRGADDGCANALARVPDRSKVASMRQQMAQLLGEVGAEIAEAPS